LNFPITNESAKAHRAANLLARWRSEKTGLTFVIYDLRHTYASRYIMAGGDIMTLKGILGHSSIRVLERYVHITRGAPAGSDGAV